MMKACPSCKAKNISEFKLLLNAITGLGTLYCNECHSMIDFQRRKQSGIREFFNWFLPELILALFLIASFIYSGNLWLGLVAFVLTRFAKAYYIYLGPLTILEH